MALVKIVKRDNVKDRYAFIGSGFTVQGYLSFVDLACEPFSLTYSGMKPSITARPVRVP